MRIFSILALTSLLLAINAQRFPDAREIYKYNAGEINFSPELQSQGLQCLTNLQTRVNVTFGEDSQELITLETLLIAGIDAMTAVEKLPCLFFLSSFQQYWNLHAQQTNIRANFERNHEEILFFIGNFLMKEIPHDQLSKSTWSFFSMASLLLGFRNSSNPTQPLPVPHLPKITPEAFFEEFFTGFLGNTLFIKNKTVIHSVAQCAVEVTYLIKHAEEGTHDLAGDILKTFTECAAMKSVLKDYARRNGLPREDALGTAVRKSTTDFLVNFAGYKRMLVRSFEDLARGDYNYCGRRVGNIFGYSLREFINLKTENYYY